MAVIGKPIKVSSLNLNEMLDSSLSRSHVPLEWRYEDVSVLRINQFVRVITTIKVKECDLNSLELQ